MLTFFRRTLSKPVVGLLLFGACHSLVDMPLPPNTQVLIPPSVYSTWWSMTEACSGLTGRMDRISWYEVPNASSIPYPGMTDVVGYWSTSNRIVLAGLSVLDGGGVRHEMLHALLQSVAHPRAAFLDKCGGIVDCGSSCVTDGGSLAPPDPATPIVSPNELQLAIGVTPAVPSAQVDGGFFAVTVGVTNTANHAIVIALPDGHVSNLGRTYSYHIQGPFGGLGGGELAFDAGELRFAANETKRHVFDFRVGYDSSLQELPPAAAYSIGAQFGSGQAWTYITATLRP